MPLSDSLGRTLRDLRVSVTDRCNFRCRYCMPREVFGTQYPFLPKSEILTFEEITRIARVFVSQGVEKIRLTGGEPLLRRNLEQLISQLAGIHGLKDLALTTNGSLLSQKARSLRAAGLQRITVSLDSLDDATFRAMSDADFSVAHVLQGIEAALGAGFSPIKINMVVRRGINEHGIAEMAERFCGRHFILRLIEYMDVGNTNGWQRTDVVSAKEMLESIGGLITPLAANAAGETALRYRTASGGEIGIIASVTQPFCRGCTRARLTASGKLHTCLFSGEGHDLRPYLRSDWGDHVLEDAIRGLWQKREDRYSETRALHDRITERSHERKAEMSLLGG